MNPGRLLDEILVNGEIVGAIFEDAEADLFVVALADGTVLERRNFDAAALALRSALGLPDEEPEESEQEVAA
ncbi:hypothetical protein [Brachybacterium hainanense]|uniref:Uncharacterized protein n=1 Tax=Brachybacterium hainanense TaxID=1541174 RepID=A0ABV6RB45_9MICO